MIVSRTSSYPYRYAGKLSIRESAAILSHASYFIGPDSLLMHIANGLNIKSTIIFGDPAPLAVLVTRKTSILVILLTAALAGSIKDMKNNENLKCMHESSVRKVFMSIQTLMKQSL